jgi:hypothetical protein
LPSDTKQNCIIGDSKIHCPNLQKLSIISTKNLSASKLKNWFGWEILPKGMRRKKDGHISNGPFQGLLATFLHPRRRSRLQGCWGKSDITWLPKFQNKMEFQLAKNDIQNNPFLHSKTV